jgi:hypothetical protein
MAGWSSTLLPLPFPRLVVMLVVVVVVMLLLLPPLLPYTSDQSTGGKQGGTARHLRATSAVEFDGDGRPWCVAAAANSERAATNVSGK